MPSFPSPFGGEDGDATFDPAGAFVPAHLPEPGPFLGDHAALTGEAHLAVHATARGVFEERTVYDMTFGYNLARLNRDTRHPDAGYRYAEATEATLRAEFTPTTPFCPQSETLTVGSFRAWNGLADRHAYDLVRVRVHPMHHRADRINDRLADLEARFRETGEVAPAGEGPETAPAGQPGSAADGTDAPL